MSGARLSDVKVGAFVLAALAILIVGSLWIAGGSIFGPERVVYEVVMADSAGLDRGDPLRFAGVSVGRIRSVTLQPAESWPVAMAVAVRPDIPVKADSRARIGSDGIFGQVYLELLAGSEGAELLPPGGRIEGEAKAGIESAMAQLDDLSVKAGDLMVKLGEVVEQLSDQVAPVLSNLERLTSEENAENVRLLLADLRQVTATAGPQLTSLVASLEESVAGVPELRDRFGAVAASLDSALGPDGERLAALLERAESEIGAAGGALSIVTDNRQELEAALRDLRATLANLKAFSEQVQQQPSSLVRGRPRPDRRPGEAPQEPRP